MSLPSYSDSVSGTPEQGLLAVDIDVGGTDPLDYVSFADIQNSDCYGQWSTASWDRPPCRSHRIGLCAAYSSTSSDASLEANEWLPLWVDTLSCGDVSGLDTLPTSVSAIDQVSPFAWLGGWTASANLDDLSQLPFLDEPPLESADARPIALQAPTTSHPKSGAVFGVTTPEDATSLSPSPPRKKIFTCPYGQCRRVCRTAQALAYAQCPIDQSPYTSALTLCTQPA